MGGLESLLEPERLWIALQPEFRTGWDKGRAWFEETVERCLGDYVQVYATGSDREKLADACRIPLGAALVYHWRSARDSALRLAPSSEPKVSGAWVVETVRSGKRPTSRYEVENAPRFMGGNPLQDLVLAVGAVSGVDRAIACLYQQYRVVFEGQARQLLGRSTPAAEWEDLVSRLLLPRSARRRDERRKKKAVPPLSLYRGYSSLRHWLRPVVRNFLTDVGRRLDTRRSAERLFAAERAARPTAAESADEAGCEHPVEALRDSLRRALARLTPQDRAILVWAYQWGLQNLEVARRLGVAPGHASRLKQKALLHLGGALRETLLSPEGPGQAGGRWQTVLVDLSPPVLGEFVRVLGDPLESEGASRPTSTMPNEHASGATLRRTEPEVQVETGAAPPWDEIVEVESPGPFPVTWRPLDREAFCCVPLDGAPEHRPETVAEGLRELEHRRRPSIICLDARGVTEVDEVTDWLDRFDAVLSDRVVVRQHELEDPLPETAEQDDMGDLYEPRRVVLAREGVIAELREVGERLLYGDVTCLPADPNGESAYELYTKFVDQTFQRAFVPPPSPRHGPPRNLRNLEETLPEAQRGEWREKMNQLTKGGFGGDPDLVS